MQNPDLTSSQLKDRFPPLLFEKRCFGKCFCKEIIIYLLFDSVIYNGHRYSAHYSYFSVHIWSPGKNTTQFARYPIISQATEKDAFLSVKCNEKK